MDAPETQKKCCICAETKPLSQYGIDRDRTRQPRPNRKCRTCMCWISFRAAARLRHGSCDITREQWLTLRAQLTCACCGEPMQAGQISIDRLNNSLPYLWENCRAVCCRCNSLKNQNDLKTLQMLADYMRHKPPGGEPEGQETKAGKSALSDADDDVKTQVLAAQCEGNTLPLSYAPLSDHCQTPLKIAS